MIVAAGHYDNRRDEATPLSETMLSHARANCALGGQPPPAKVGGAGAPYRLVVCVDVLVVVMAGLGLAAVAATGFLHLFLQAPQLCRHGPSALAVF
jgi:hypothetical protein